MKVELPVVAFVGGGNMARAMIGGLISKGQPPGRILVSDPSTEKGANLKRRFGVRATTNTVDAVQAAEVIVLAVKPQVIDVVTAEIADRCQTGGKVFVSITAGVPVSRLEGALGQDAAVVRLMPNIPALIGYGMSGLFANPNTSIEQKQHAMSIALSCGECIEIQKEADINTVTALSGSGPAYFLLMMEAMIKAATDLDFSEEDARRLTYQTALGTAQLAIISDKKPSELRQQIASTGGTTESALNHLANEGFMPTIEAAVKAAYNRAVELGAK